MLTVFRTALLLLAFAASAAARFGAVETRDGRFHEGHIRIESNGVVVVNAALDLWTHVPLTNLAALTMEQELEPLSGHWLAPVPTSAGLLPPPWRNEDIGSAPTPGAATTAWNKFRVTSSGTNITGDNDAFHFVFKPVRGASEIVARVWSSQLGDGTAKAGLMMRESLAGDSPNVFLGISAGRGGFTQWRRESGSATEGMFDANPHATPWLKLKRNGDTFSAFKSRNGRQWTLLRQVQVSMGDAMLVGLAATGGRQGMAQRAVFDQIEEAPVLRNRWFVPRVALRGGSIASGYIVEMNDSVIRFHDESGPRSVSTDAALHLNFQFVPDRWSALVASGRPGILLTTGQFIDGECRGIAEGTVTISSIPLGLCRFEINSEVIAVVLRKASPGGQRDYLIRTIDGSVWFASSLTIEGQSIVLREPGLGNRRVPLHDLVELRRRS